MGLFLTILLAVIVAGPTKVVLADLKRLQNREVGYIITHYPDTWQIKDQVAATGFASEAECQSLQIVDFAPPPASGPAAFKLHSFVQICAQHLRNPENLDEFMRRTYGSADEVKFRKTELNGMHAYISSNTDESSVIFLETENHRIQIVTSVVASEDVRAQRISEVGQILEHFVLTPSRARGELR